MPNPADPPRKPWLTAVPAVLLVLVALWEIVATRCQATGVPGDDDWEVASKIVRAGYKPGDLIVFAPSWADPIGRLHLGDLIPLDMAARMDGARYGRVWELSIRFAAAPEVVDEQPVEVHDGPVTVHLYERHAPTVLAALVDRMSEPRTRTDLAEVGFEPHRCVLVPTLPVRPYLDGLLASLDRMPAGKPRDAMLRMFDTMLPELGQARMRPATERTGTTIKFRGLPLGTALVGYVGIADVFTRREDRAPITLDVDAGGGHTSVTAPIDQWVPFSIATTPGTGDATFVIHWEAQPGEVWGAKQVCFDAEARL